MVGKYQVYPECKDSGIEWFGLVPESWFSSRLKFESAINMGQSPSSDDCNQDGLGLPFLQGNADFGFRSPSPRHYCDFAKKIAHKGELLFSVRAPVGALNLADQEYCIGRGLCAISSNDSLISKFLWWLIPVIKSELDSVSTGSTFEAVSAEQVGNVIFYRPSVSEQEKIANFLDHETAKIDTLIEKQQQLIKLLKEKRQAVISHAVTKGLNPNAPMRDSGVEWFTELPEHWKVGKLGYYAKITNGATPSRENKLFWEEGSVGWLNSSKVNDVRIFEADQFITPLAVTQTSVQNVTKQDLVIAITGEGQTRGRVAICFTDATISQHLATISITDRTLNFEFLFFYLTSQYERIRLESSSAGSTKGAITCGDIVSYPLAVPPAKEQQEIVKHIIEIEGKLESLSQLAVEQINLLHERRTALISAAVTGKIDVRNWQAPAPVNNAYRQTN